jgi:hypothetical protein
MTSSNLTRCFWGPVDPNATLGDVRRLIAPFGEAGAYAGDNLIAFGRNLGFLSDAAFMRAFTGRIAESNYIGYGILWRLYIFSWAARTCLRRDGDFVECGVSTGMSSAIMCDYLDFATVAKTLYLYDAWARDPRVDGTPYGLTADTLREVQATFAPFPNAVLVPGFVPETFATVCPDRIAFLHVDLNSADAEIAVLDHLFDRVVPGGIVLFDDYGFSGYLASQQAEDTWMQRRGYTIAELPTGQGLLIK